MWHGVNLWRNSSGERPSQCKNAALYEELSLSCFVFFCAYFFIKIMRKKMHGAKLTPFLCVDETKKEGRI